MPDEITKAVTAVANAVEKVVDMVTDIGHYAAEVAGNIPHDYVGLKWGDKIRIRRLQNIAVLMAEAKPLIERIAPDRISEPSPSLLIPLITASADEERAELRMLWAKLLANSAIDGGARVRREFYETVQKLEPIDVVVLDIFDEPIVMTPTSTSEQMKGMKNALEARNVKAGLNDINLHVALNALQQHRCIDRQSNSSLWCLTSYGKALKLACKVE